MKSSQINQNYDKNFIYKLDIGYYFPPPPPKKKKKKKQLTWQNARQLSNYKHDMYTAPFVLK